MRNVKQQPADICLLLEGTYPYVSGGVSSWVHKLITEHSHLSFHLHTLLPQDSEQKRKYTIPENVTGITNTFVQYLAPGSKKIPSTVAVDFFSSLKTSLQNLFKSRELKDLKDIIAILKSVKEPLGAEFLLNSKESWNLLLEMNKEGYVNAGFLNYFWSWRSLISGLFSILLTPLPEAKLYHATCTGYAGLMLACAKIITNKACLLTEHGIYTNERRIEIVSADWLLDKHEQNFDVFDSKDTLLHRFWLDTFSAYSKLCYDASDEIITLYEGNFHLQIEDGADENKLRIIANGIDYDTFSSVTPDPNHPPTIALIGRVVPIKDIKTYIRAVDILRKHVEGLVAYVLGPTDEDEDYYHECMELVDRLDLGDVLSFTGKVDIKEYLQRIDVIVLTSLSEAQPLVILEAGACGVVSVVTNVGACFEMMHGRSDEDPPLGQAGIVCPLSNPVAISEALEKLLSDEAFYQQCSQAIKARVKKYYHREVEYQAYKNLYARLLVPKTLNEVGMEVMST